MMREVSKSRERETEIKKKKFRNCFYFPLQSLKKQAKHKIVPPTDPDSQNKLKKAD